MYAILTKYHGPTNTLPSRISARAEDCKPVFISHPDSEGIHSTEESHRQALAAFLRDESGNNRMDWWDTAARNPDNWMGGWIEYGYAFVFVAPKENAS